jgi:putative SOS response-associated peptidase YedK
LPAQNVTIDKVRQDPTATAMCNLYRLSGTLEAAAHSLGAEFTGVSRSGENIYPTHGGLVVAKGEACIMTWGFPRVLLGAQGQTLRPTPINTVQNNKLRKARWRPDFEANRCLIPIHAWAVPEGEEGRQTRTWYRPHGEDLITIAGIWRDSVEWGRCFAMVLAPADGREEGGQSYIPAIVAPEDRETWVTGTPDEAFSLCRAWMGELIAERTPQSWAR